MKVKTSELTGDNLGYAVALIEYPEWKEQGYLESVHDLYFDDGEHYAPGRTGRKPDPSSSAKRFRSSTCTVQVMAVQTCG